MPRETEVEDLGVAVLRQKDVLGLDVAVDDPLLVGSREPLRNLPGDVERPPRRERAVRHGHPERLALEELADGEPEAALVADVEEREDVGMREGGNRLRLGREARERLGVARQLLGQHLDRDLALEPRVPRAVDLAHAAGAERGNDLVRAEPGSCRKTHLLRGDSKAGE